MNKYVIKVGLTGSGVGQERNGRRFRGVLSIGGKVKAAYHKVVPQKAGATFVEDPIVLSQEDRDARDEDLAHYKKALGYAGQQSPAHDWAAGKMLIGSRAYIILGGRNDIPFERHQAS